MSARINYITLLVGKRGCGKTTTAIQLAVATGKRILVINTDNNDAYNSFPLVNIDSLHNWKGTKGICVTSEPLRALEILNTSQKNLFIICDDTQKYIGQTVEREAKIFMINHRMNNFDVVFMYHSLKFIPPYLAMQFNQIVLFKTLDSDYNDLRKKFNNFNALARKMLVIKDNPSPYYCEIINDTDE